MRLTLRTMLAYLDDILPPAEAKELGEKIAASPVATQYVERIRDVMRRRRLTAPETDGSGGGIEPNLVAEYLDNSLSPERVADVERVCLESDVNLAEVAACHQILTLVLGEPVEISGRLRERMYALGPQGTALEVHEPNNRGGETTAREQLAAIQAAQRPKPVPAARPLESRLPDYLRQKPLWKRVLPWVAVAAVILIWLGVLAYDPTFFGGRAATETEKDRTADEAEPDGVVVADVDKPREEPREPLEADTGPRDIDDEPVVAAADLPELPVDPEPPADDEPIMDEDTPRTDGAKPPEMAASATAVAAADAKPTEEVTPMEPVEASESVVAAPPTRAPAADGAPAIDVVSKTGTVLRFDAPSGQWFPMGTDEEPKAGAAIAVPAPFETKVAVGDLPLDATVLGGTRFKAFGQTEAGPVGFDLVQGRLRLAAFAAQPPEPSEMMFALRLGPALWRIEPLTPDTTLGIEALPLQPTGEGQDLSDRTPQGVVYVGSGAVRVVDSSGRVEVASAGNRLILTPDGDGAIGTPAGVAAPAAAVTESATEENDAEELIDAPTEAAEAAEGAATSEEPSRGLPTADLVDPATSEEKPADAVPEGTMITEAATPEEATAKAIPIGVPDWMTPREPTSAARRAMVAFQKEFVPGAPAGQSLLPAVDSPLFYVAEPAAKALGLIEDVDGMVKALRDSEHPEAVLAAIEGLRNWLGRSPEHGEILKTQLNLVFARAGMSDILEELLWGYDLDDARDDATARQLVEWLDHPEPVVRELAFYHVRRLSGRTMYYRPNQTPSDRIGAVNRWREFVNRNGGLIVGE